MRVARLVLSVSISFLLSVSLAAQEAATSSPQALQLLQQSLNALGGQTLSDVTLSGTARRIAGSDDESGTGVLKALARGEARVDLSLPSGPRSEVRAIANNCQVGSWSGPDGVAHPMSNHNLMTDSAWFFPAFTVGRLVSASNYVASYVGHETRNSRAVEHLTVYQPSNFQTPTGIPTLSHLTQMDLFLDSSTLLPAALTFNAHPDNDMGLDIPIEIRFSDYRPVNGAQVPFRVQRYLNNGLTLNLEFETATLNSGLTATSFSAQ